MQTLHFSSWSPDPGPLTVSGPLGLRTAHGLRIMQVPQTPVCWLGVGTPATPCTRCMHLQGHALSCLAVSRGVNAPPAPGAPVPGSSASFSNPGKKNCGRFGLALFFWVVLFGFKLGAVQLALTFRLLGFSAFGLLGFLAFWLFGFLASASWLLGFLASIVCRVIAPLFEPTLLQASWGGVPPPPPLLFRFLAEIDLHPCLNHHFSKRPISRENAAKYNILGNLCNPCMSVCMHFFEHHRRNHPRQPSRCLLNSITPFPESLHPYLNHHLLRHHGWGCRGGLPPPPTPPLRFRFSARIYQFFEHHGGGLPQPTPPLLFRFFAQI